MADRARRLHRGRDAVGLPTFRLRGHYFVLASVFIMQAVYIVVSNWDALGAAIGLEFPVYKATGLADALWHLQFPVKLPYYYGVLALFEPRWWPSSDPALADRPAVRRHARGRGRRAEPRRRTCALQTLALIVSAAITTLCGMFYAQYVLYVEPAARSR